MGSRYDGARIGVVGGGIVGLAVARELAVRRGVSVTVFEKEVALATHQTGHNSGVVHAGIYYEPGSLKATLCRRGVGLLRDYCLQHGIAYHEVGKVVVASTTEEIPRLRRIEEKARANGVPGVVWLDRARLAEVEPHVEGVAALHSPSTAITDFVGVARQLAADVTAAGGRVLLGSPVTAIVQSAGGVSVTAAGSVHELDGIVVCAGLSTDVVARAANMPADVRIVPFRGEYYRLSVAANQLVHGLVYPVPDPRYPFLGVHLTRRHDGEVLAGPNAVLALAREGYRWADVDLSELREFAGWAGFARLARRHWRTGVREMVGSLSKHAFAAMARRYVPALRTADLVAAPAGVRAQAVASDGSLVDDFQVQNSGRVTIVRNAPSPAATSSLAIAESIVDQIPA
jgi:L-2-hydroxyglutarate oxidase LhgO